MGWGNHLLFLEVSENCAIDLLLLHLVAVAGALSPHNFACPTKTLHPQSLISPHELSLSGCPSYALTIRYPVEGGGRV